MKKLYTTPCAKFITLDCANVIANSLPVVVDPDPDDKITDEGQILSNRRGLGGGMWDDM